MLLGRYPRGETGEVGGGLTTPDCGAWACDITSIPYMIVAMGTTQDLITSLTVVDIVGNVCQAASAIRADNDSTE